MRSTRRNSAQDAKTPVPDEPIDVEAPVANGPTNPSTSTLCAPVRLSRTTAPKKSCFRSTSASRAGRSISGSTPTRPTSIDVPLLTHEQGMNRQFYWVAPGHACAPGRTPRLVSAVHLLVEEVADFPLAGEAPDPRQFRRGNGRSPGCVAPTRPWSDWGQIRADPEGGGYTGGKRRRSTTTRPGRTSPWTS